MGHLTDKFLNMLRLNDEYDEYDDYDEYDEYEEEIAVKPKRPERKETLYSERVRGGNSTKPKNTREPKRYDEDNYRETAVAAAPRQKPVRQKANKVIPMRGGSSGMEVCVVKSANIDDAREITETLLSGRTVVLNLEGIHVDVAQRIIDFTSGSCYAINGNLQKISNYIFIVTPETVDISGDFQDILGNGGIDISTL